MKTGDDHKISFFFVSCFLGAWFESLDCKYLLQASLAFFHSIVFVSGNEFDDKAAQFFAEALEVKIKHELRSLNKEFFIDLSIQHGERGEVVVEAGQADKSLVRRKSPCCGGDGKGIVRRRVPSFTQLLLL